MHKEIIIAIALGSLLGLVVAFGVWKANSAFSDKEKSAVVDESTSEDNEGVLRVASQKLTVSAPRDRSVLTEDTVEVRGATKAGALVIVTTGEDEIVAGLADKQGVFSVELELAGGVNQFVVFSVDREGNQVSQDLAIAYSSLLDDTEEESSDLEKKVDSKIEKARQNLEFYMGALTDVSENALQLRSEAGEIKQVSFDEEITSFANVVKTSKKIESDELAIGDFVVAMGSVTGKNNGVLEAKRILVDAPVDPVEVRAVFGEITEVRKGLVLIASSDDEVEIEIGSSTDIATFSDEGELVTKKQSSLEEGQKLVAVLNDEDEEVSTLAIYLTTLID